MSLDLSNHDYIFASKLPLENSETKKSGKHLVSLPIEAWNEDKKELILGTGSLQISIVQPNIYSSMSCKDNDDTDMEFSDKKKRWFHLDVSVQDVLLRRYFSSCNEELTFQFQILYAYM